MSSNEYIYQFLRFSPIKVDETDEYFLWHIMKGYTSVYKLYSFLKKIGEPMAYKNVHRRVTRFVEGGLIDEIKVDGGYKHGAKNYRLTSRGLVYIFSELLTPNNIHEIILKDPGNILYRTFVLPFFEIKTLKHCSYSLMRLIENHLEEVCQSTRYFLNPERLELYSNDPEPMIQILEFQLNWRIRSFLLKVAMMKKELTDWRYTLPRSPEDRLPSMEKIQCTANDKIETYELLSKDKKFMNALEEIEEEFSEGYDKLIELKNKKNSEYYL